tara:strand:+ start:416 stop:1804 length:1389 start_codon:yes stop_codon:yes gene_type:complete
LFLTLPALVVLAAGAGCVSARPIAELEEGEWLPGGQATNTLLLGRNAFLAPAPNLSADNEAQFFVGNSFFNDAWVEAPASTGARDGLGPVFNARACAVCHFRDGRAAPPESSEDSKLGTLVRLSVPREKGPGQAPESVYGGQFHDNAINDVEPEGDFTLSWEELPGRYDDGSSYSLRRPVLEFTELNYGSLHSETMFSVRIAPQMFGLGLLEGLDDDTLLRLSDPDDSDGDGISGRVSSQLDGETGELRVGRFGWKAEQPTIRTQTAAALNGDIGITTSIFADDDCTEFQPECLAAESGGVPEVEEEVLHGLSVYAAALAVPVRRDWEEAEVLRGKLLFSQLNCSACHLPNHQTSDSAPLPELAEQSIWPYTDLLLHDMGEGLADGRPVGDATGREWKTPPLWGLGLIPTVNGHDNLLHDGRARGFAEAILWHGGEAEAAALGFRALDAEDREALIRFLASL